MKWYAVTFPPQLPDVQTVWLYNAAICYVYAENSFRAGNMARESAGYGYEHRCFVHEVEQN